MDHDPVVEEVRATRDKFAKSHDYDIDAMVKALQDESEQHGRQLVTLSPKPVSEEEFREAS